MHDSKRTIMYIVLRPSNFVTSSTRFNQSEYEVTNFFRERLIAAIILCFRVATTDSSKNVDMLRVSNSTDYPRRPQYGRDYSGAGDRTIPG